MGDSSLHGGPNCSTFQRSVSLPINLHDEAEEFFDSLENVYDDADGPWIPLTDDDFNNNFTKSSSSSSLSGIDIGDSIRDEDMFFFPIDEDLDEVTAEPYLQDSIVSHPTTMTSFSTSVHYYEQEEKEEEKYEEHEANKNVTMHLHYHIHHEQQHQQQIQQQIQQQYKHRPIDEEMARIEEFFTGGTALFGSREGSPVSVMETSLMSRGGTTKQQQQQQPQQKQHQRTGPKLNMFGHVIQDEVPVVPTLDHQPNETHSRSLQQEQQQYPQHKLRMLRKSDRSNSLPTDYASHPRTTTTTTTTGHPLTKRPSLKKVSSIGTFPKKREDSEGSLPKRTVSFSDLQIREYNVALSDHPSCSYGPPVQLSWDYNEKATVPLESYEESRQPRRGHGDLLLSYYDRRFLLIKQAGYSKREVKKAMKEVERVKRERMITDMFLPASYIHETFESFVGTIKDFFFDDQQKQQEEEQQYYQYRQPYEQEQQVPYSPQSQYYD